MDEALAEPVNALAAGSNEAVFALDGSETADLTDIGFYSNYNDGTLKYTGIFRDATDGKWKLFAGSTSGPSSEVFPDISGSLGTLQVGSLELPRRADPYGRGKHRVNIGQFWRREKSFSNCPDGQRRHRCSGCWRGYGCNRSLHPSVATRPQHRHERRRYDEQFRSGRESEFHDNVGNGGRRGG